MVHLVLTLKGHVVGRFALDVDRIRVGRHPENEVPIDSRAVSRFHCAFTRGAGGAWVVEDLQSNNGTFVNGARVARHELRPADVVTVGSFDLTLRGEPEAAPRDPAAPGVLRSPEARELAATERAFLLVQNRAGPPILLERDVLQIGSEPGIDIHVPGPRKRAVIVRGHGGFQVLNVGPARDGVALDGRPVEDRAWLAEGQTLDVGDLRVTFHRGAPHEDQSTIALDMEPYRHEP